MWGPGFSRDEKSDAPGVMGPGDSGGTDYVWTKGVSSSVSTDEDVACVVTTHRTPGRSPSQSLPRCTGLVGAFVCVCEGIPARGRSGFPCAGREHVYASEEEICLGRRTRGRCWDVPLNKSFIIIILGFSRVKLGVRVRTTGPISLHLGRKGLRDGRGFGYPVGTEERMGTVLRSGETFYRSSDGQVLSPHRVVGVVGCGRPSPTGPTPRKEDLG